MSYVWPIYPKSANGSGYIVTWTLQGAATAQTRPRVTSFRAAAHEQVGLPGEATRIATPREPLVKGHPAARKMTTQDDTQHYESPRRGRRAETIAGNRMRKTWVVSKTVRGEVKAYTDTDTSEGETPYSQKV